MERTADRMLLFLKTRGPRTTAQLGKLLGTSSEAARQQLSKLQQAGLVTGQAVGSGVGRPAFSWRLTPRATERFPDTHAELTVQLIENMRAVLGEKALSRVIAQRERQMLASYTAALATASTLAERVARLVDLRSAEGYMAELEPCAGGFLIVENHCPICAAATACQGFCRSELELFQAVLGPDVLVSRTDHIVAGGRRCVYAVAPAKPHLTAS